MAAGIRPFIESAAVIEVRAEAGDVLVAHNHRLLHGRRGFDGSEREFTRLLVWRGEALPFPAAWRERAERAAARTGAALSAAPWTVRERFGLAEEPDPQARRRLRVVLDLLRGVPAGVLAARECVPEPELYRWRTAALSAALGALAAEPDHADDRKVRAALAQLLARARPPV